MVFIFALPILATYQASTWNQFELNIPSLSQTNNDLLITLSISSPLQSLLLLGGLLEYPTVSYSPFTEKWNVLYDYDDFQGWITRKSVLMLRISNAVASSISIFYIGIYKTSSESVNYNISVSEINNNDCEHTCVNGVCTYGYCVCSSSQYMGYDCSINTNYLSLNAKSDVLVSSNSWIFYQLYYSIGVSYKAEIKNIQPGITIYEIQTEDSYYLPSMHYYLNEYTFNSSTQESTFPVDSGGSKYWIWGIYCNSLNPCQISISFSYSSSSSSQSFLWIIVSSIISLAFICVGTPIILKIIIRYKEML